MFLPLGLQHSKNTGTGRINGWMMNDGATLLLAHLLCVKHSAKPCEERGSMPAPEELFSNLRTG